MPRTVLACLIALLCAPAAHASAKLTVTTDRGSMEPMYVSSMHTLLEYQPPATLIGDGCLAFGFCELPALAATPGSAVTITVDGPVDELTARVGEATAVATGARAYGLTLPADLPAQLEITVHESTPTEISRTGYRLALVAPPAPPPPPVVVAAPVVVPPAPTLSSLRLTGRRLSLKVACPAAATRGCAGTVTLRTPSLRVARIAFTSIAAGAGRVLRATVRPSALRRVRRVKTLRAIVVSADAAVKPVETRLRLRV